jgi:hypothetical protein
VLDGLRHKYGITYLSKIPTADQVPDDLVVVHNNVYPVARRLGMRGSRAWLQQPADLAVCDCGWAPEAGTHYRINPR